MLILLSPSKTLDFDSPWKTPEATQPVFLKDSEALIKTMRGYSEEEIARLMEISPKLAKLNHERYRAFKTPFTEDNSRPALTAFRGDVYEGLDAPTLKPADLKYAQMHLRILSGLYGLLRPLDLIQPYRLEMGISVPTKKGKNLYEYWGGKLTARIEEEAAASGGENCVINLASQEYFSAIKPKKLTCPVITPVFKDYNRGSYRVIGLLAKRARGMMARHIITQRLKAPKDLICPLKSEKTLFFNGILFIPSPTICS